MAPAEVAGGVVADRYELRSLLGRGGMGQVWLARDTVLHRDVAVKEVTIPTSFTDVERSELRDRTLREARAAARFEHPRVTTVHDVVEQDGRPWIVMEHVPSRSLAEWVQDGPLPVARVVRIGLDVLSALEAAHLAGIIHRDVKPANVLVSQQGRAWLTDFGIASSAGDSRLTGHGVLLGSPAYIAPERARGDESGPSVDVWGLGATLYFAVEGRPPFDRGEGMATLLAITTEQPPRPTAAGPLEPVLAALLERDPVRRPTVEQATIALERLASGIVVQPLPPAGRASGPEHPGGWAPVPPGPVAPPGQVAPPGPAPQTGPAPQPGRRPQPGGVPAGERPAGGHSVERIDLEELAGFAAAATKAVAGSAARRLADRAARPVPPRPVSRPGRQPARSRRWRFKRRWVVTPLVVAVLVTLVVVALLVAGMVELLGVDD